MADDLVIALLLGNHGEPRPGESMRMGILRDRIPPPSKEFNHCRPEYNFSVMRILGLEGEFDTLTSNGEPASAWPQTLTRATTPRELLHPATSPDHSDGEQEDATAVALRTLPPGNNVANITGSWTILHEEWRSSMKFWDQRATQFWDHNNHVARAYI